MTSRYVKRAGLIVGSVAVGAAIATSYRLSSYDVRQSDYHRHQRSGRRQSSFVDEDTPWHGRGSACSSTEQQHTGADGAPPSPLASTWQGVAAYLLLPLQTRRKLIYEAFFGSCEDGRGRGGGTNNVRDAAGCHERASPVAHAQSISSSNDDDGGSASSPASPSPTFWAVPTDIKSRFLMYARRDPTTGEYVQQLDDFIACLLLLAPFSLSASAKDGPLPPDPAVPPASEDGALALPDAVQARVAKLFPFVDMDQSRTVTYAEFVVFFTLLSTQKRVLKMAFDVFQRGEGNGEGRVSELEFTRLLNVLMADPSVQVTYDGKARDGAEAAPTKSGRSAGKAADVPSFLEADASAPADFAMSLASQTRRARRARGEARGNLSFTIPSSHVWGLFRGPPPKHELAPPGSMHNNRSLLNWKHRERMSHLNELAERDRQQRALSFDAFWYRMDFLRWELRAVEFGIFDPDNEGVISLQDFRRILSHDMESSLAGRRGARSTAAGGGGDLQEDKAARAHQSMGQRSVEKQPTPATARPATRPYFNFGSRWRLSSVPPAVTNEPVPALPVVDDAAKVITWQFYQTVFDIIRESDATMAALKLALNAEPPVLPSQLRSGAVPDKAKSEPRVEEEPEGKATSTGEQLASLVRPTALTWKQFGQVLRASPSVPPLTAEEQQLFFAVFDADGSGTVTPEEFAQLCELKRSFFATYAPRFSEPPRNVIQQFVFCMQQLE